MLNRGFVYFALVSLILLVGCDEARSTSGVKKASVSVPVDLRGRTTEQNNISQRLLSDNKLGAIKHLYVISAYSGQVLIYSTVKGKVTSSGKRLSPTTIDLEGRTGFKVDIADVTNNYYTGEVLQDDGTYGSSAEYLYWWDTKDIYHQHYVSGGQILHISSEPISVKSIVINLNNETPTDSNKGK